jgi:hypothetical protein
MIPRQPENHPPEPDASGNPADLEQQATNDTTQPARTAEAPPSKDAEDRVASYLRGPTAFTA